MLNTAAAFLVLFAKHKRDNTLVSVSHSTRVAFVEVDNGVFCRSLDVEGWSELQVDVLVSRQENDRKSDGCISV